jgi:hypothetical protein
MTTIIKKITIIAFALFFVLLNCRLVYAIDERPVSSAVAITGELITLTENTTANVIVTATVTDTDGCEDIDSVSVKFFRTDLTSSGADDANHRYTQAAVLDTGTCEGGGDLSSTWTATISVQYYADPTDAGAYSGTTWSAEVIPSDHIGAGTTEGNDTTEMATLKALEATTPIAYGELALNGNTGTTDQTTTITNTGNTAIGVQVDGYGSIDGDGKSMICTSGSVLLENEKYSKTALTAYASKTVLTDTAATVADFSINQRTDGASTNVLYWGFGMPINGVGGSCAGTVVFTAI